MPTQAMLAGLAKEPQWMCRGEANKISGAPGNARFAFLVLVQKTNSEFGILFSRIVIQKKQ